MLCCVECFYDEFLISHIEARNEKGNCDFCGARDVFTIECTQLEPFFDLLIGIYQPIEAFMPLDILKDYEGEMIWERLQSEWQIFDNNDPNFGEHLLTEICASWWDRKSGMPQIFHSAVEIPSKWIGIEEHSDRLVTRWEDFCEEIKFQNRFFPQHLNPKVLLQVLTYSEAKISTKRTFHRARLNPNHLRFKMADMAMPPRHLATAGRANPKGIPYLYLSTNEKTCVHEVRPSPTDNVTVAKFVIKSELKVIDLSPNQRKSPFSYGDKLEDMLFHQSFLTHLAEEVSKPRIGMYDDPEFLPTQYLCEFIKNAKYDGLLFKSIFGYGNNLVLFGEEKVACDSIRNVKIEDMDMEEI